MRVNHASNCNLIFDIVSGTSVNKPVLHFPVRHTTKGLGKKKGYLYTFNAGFAQQSMLLRHVGNLQERVKQHMLCILQSFLLNN